MGAYTFGLYFRHHLIFCYSLVAMSACRQTMLISTDIALYTQPILEDLRYIRMCPQVTGTTAHIVRRHGYCRHSATAAGPWRDAVTIDAQTSSQTDIQYSKIRSVSEIYTATGKYRSLYQFYMSPEAMDTSGYLSSIFCIIWDRSKLFLTNYRPKTESAGAVRKCAFSFKLFRPLHKSYTAVTKIYLSKR